MLKLIVVLTILAHLNYILSESTTSSDTSNNSSSSSTSNESSSYSSNNSSSSSSTFSNVSNSHYEQNQSEGSNTETEQPATTSEQPTSEQPTSEQPTSETTSENPPTSTEQPTTTPEQTNTTTNTGTTSSLIDAFNNGNLKFTANFFKYVVDANPGESVIMSAFSLEFLLAALVRCDAGESTEQLLSVLNLKNKNEIRTAIPAILDLIEEQKNVTLTLAAKIYGNDKNKFNDTFLADTTEILRATAENIDMSDPATAAATINKWVADNTNNLIKDLIPETAITKNTELVLVNALYFLGEWRNQFNPDATTPEEFYLPGNTTVLVDTMHQVKFFRYVRRDNLNAQVLELPYVNENLTTLIVLPDDIEGAAQLVSKLDSNELNSIKESLQYERVSVSLPKYNTTTSINLKQLLQELNVTAIFDPSKSCLNDLIVDGQNLYVSEAIQKANIRVDEVGSEAAAANAIIVSTTSAVLQPPIEFKANRSFAYYILFRGYPLFTGLYAGK